MPTTYTDQFYQMDPANPPASGTLLSPVSLNLVDQNNNGTITSAGGTGVGDSLGGVDITAVYNGDTVTVNHNGTPLTITGVTFYLADGRRFFTPKDGTVLQADNYISSTWVSPNTSMPVGQLGPPCFTPGTLIRVPGGAVPVETLTAGDLVETMDHGPQVLRWVGQNDVDGSGDYAPIAIGAESLGNDRELLVSPEHRMLVTGWLAELNFGEDEVLVAAKHLVGLPGIAREEQQRVTYLHLLFDRHEIIFAEGAPSESLHPSSWLIERDSALRAEIEAVFPDLTDRLEGPPAPAARRVVTLREARLIAA